MQRTTALKKRAADAVPASAPLRVLIADPDADTRALYQTALALDGCYVIEATDGRDALTKALVQPPTLIISELRLPLMNGDALCEILRRDAATCSIPILIVTAEARSMALERIQEAGADAVLVKPTTPDAVVSEGRRLVARARELREQSAALLTRAVTQRDTSDELCARLHPHRTVLSKSHRRFTTTTPPTPPPSLTCPSCDRALQYEQSHVGGVSDRYAEQWDYYCCATCGTFQYRQRTHKLRRVQ